MPPIFRKREHFMEILEAILGQYGGTVTFIIGFLFLLGKGIHYSLRRLLDEDKGIITHVAEEHIKLIKNISDTQYNQHIDIIDVKNNLSELLDMHRDGNTTFSNRRLHEAGLIACNVLEDIANSIDGDIDITEDLRKIRSTLADG